MKNENENKKLIHKIKSLLAKTVEQGCSEDEAMLAMSKAHELLEKYQLDLSDLDIREEGTEHITTKLTQIMNDLAVRVGQYCEVKVWKHSDKKANSLHFVGITTDAQFAEWLILALADYVSKQQLNFMFNAEGGFTTALEDASFTQGCVHRINERLKAEVQKRELNRQFMNSNGRDLVPLKNQMIQEKLKSMGIVLHSTKKKQRTYVDPNAYHAGMKAGDGVGFHRPVSSEDRSVRLLK